MFKALSWFMVIVPLVFKVLILLYWFILLFVLINERANRLQ